MAVATPQRIFFNGSPVDEFKTAKKMGYEYAAPLPDTILSNVEGMRAAFGISISQAMVLGEGIQINVDYRLADCDAVFGAWRTSSVVLRMTELTVSRVYRLELRIPSDHLAGFGRGVIEVAFFRKGSGVDNYAGNLHVHWILNYDEDAPANNTPAWFLCGVAL